MANIARPLPFGAHPTKGGVRFAVRAPTAREVTVSTSGREVPLKKEGEVWEGEIEGLKPKAPYTFRVDGDKGLLDPYAKTFTETESWTREGPYQGRAVVPSDEPFDWEGVESPCHPLSELIIYEAHVRAFTANAHLPHPGTFLGLIGAIPYLKKLGINAIELLPVYEFDPSHYRGKNPEGGEPLKNFWGYGSLGFFAPMSGYAAVDPVHEFQTLVREMHRAGIEVLLDVVYNHTGEGPLLLYHQKEAYYLLSEGHHTNYSGCGNTLACNAPDTMELILESLRYWATEMRVDGFRFDLASIMTRGADGNPLENPPLLAAIAADPLLSRKKLIAEPWDCGGLYQVGQFPKWGPWAEWNGPFRDAVRRFLRGADQTAEIFREALLGSPQIYAQPSSSVNFVTAHDGFSLHDLVSYNEKHNEANGEDNRDGSNHNESWNCGIEGPTADSRVCALRARQQRNFFLALLMARGIPMIQMGDEVGHSKGGNNNTWCQDNYLNYFPWEGKDRDLLRFVRKLIRFRKDHPELKLEKGTATIDEQFVSLLLPQLYLAFNAGPKQRKIDLPEGTWMRVVDTVLPPPHDYSEEPSPLNATYLMEAHSALLLER